MAEARRARKKEEGAEEWGLGCCSPCMHQGTRVRSLWNMSSLVYPQLCLGILYCSSVTPFFLATAAFRLGRPAERPTWGTPAAPAASRRPPRRGARRPTRDLSPRLRPPHTPSVAAHDPMLQAAARSSSTFDLLAAVQPLKHASHPLTRRLCRRGAVARARVSAAADLESGIGSTKADGWLWTTGARRASTPIHDNGPTAPRGQGGPQGLQAR